MRPLRLELEGFGTFVENTVLEFESVDLCAFVGPTGAGKSTLIDAMTFALYGSVVRYDDTKKVAPAINLGASEARVMLDFELAGQAYRAARVVRRQSGSPSKATTKEARLEILADDNSRTLAGSVKDLDTEIPKLLGLDFNQFTRTIVLPQGEFAKFLKEKPKDRQALLVELLDLGFYTKMGNEARRRARDADLRIETLQAERERQGLLENSELQRLELYLKTVTAARKVSAKLLTEQRAVEEELSPLRVEVNGIDEQKAKLAKIVEPKELANLAEQTKSLTAEREAAQGRLAASQAEQDQIEKEIAVLPSRSIIAEASAGLKELDQLGQGRVEAQQRLKTAEEKSTELQAQKQALAVKVEELETALRAARLKADAAVWITELSQGEPCPVCQQVVHEIPEFSSSNNTEVSQAHESRNRELKEIDKDLQHALDNNRRAAAQIEQIDTRSEFLNTQITQIGGLEALETADSKYEQEAAGQRALREAAGALRQVEKEFAQLEDAHRRIGQQLAEVRDSVAELSPPSIDPDDLLASWRELIDWSGKCVVKLDKKREQLSVKGKDLARRLSELDAQLRDQAIGVNIDFDPQSFGEALAAVEAEAKAGLEQARRQREDDERRQAEIKAASKQQVLDKALSSYLRADKFEAWLLDEVFDSMAQRATTWLNDLTKGQYSMLRLERDFEIVDHGNADERRSARTLSGGETFLASLSLALALADTVAEMAPLAGPKIESLFLDEGFGTLDSETLDVVASAIEELADRGRMIGVVTHIAELADRMPVRFEVTKGVSGSSVGMVGAG